KSGTSNVYAVNKQIAWSSWGSNFKHGKFSANIILSESEQDEQVKLEIQKHKEVSLKEENNTKTRSSYYQKVFYWSVFLFNWCRGC
ncbi:hypothetical protein U2060_15165, partial [Listeria monocytogenes]